LIARPRGFKFNVMHRVLVSAGDHSGDLILSKIVSTLSAAYSGKVEFVGLAGPLSQAAGVKPIGRTQDVAVVGIIEVIRNLKKIFSVLGKLEKELKNVDSVLCVDFPDFNLKLAGMAKKQGKPVDYIIAPQVWAWRKHRLPNIKSLLRKLYVALPFEKEVFIDAGVNADFLGHPIRDALMPLNRRGARENLKIEDSDFVFCMMPGSRHAEISRHLAMLVKSWKLFLQAADQKGLQRKELRYRALVAVAQGQDRESFLAHLSGRDRKEAEALLESGEWVLVYQSHLAQMASDFGWIASGTASLESAYYQLPHILFYKLSPVSAWLIKSLTSYFSDPNSFAGLPNILLRRSVIPELLQDQVSARRLAAETVELLLNPGEMSNMKKSLRFIPKKLGDPGVSFRIAEDLAELWKL
jgi:lipid-A-disaccharide synthase